MLDLRTGLIKSIDEDLLSMKTLKIKSMADTDTVYSEINLGDDSILDNKMPIVKNRSRGRIHSTFKMMAGPDWLSDNSLRTTRILAPTDSLDLQDKHADMILEAKIVEDNSKSNFGYSCG